MVNWEITNDGKCIVVVEKTGLLRFDKRWLFVKDVFQNPKKSGSSPINTTLYHNGSDINEKDVTLPATMLAKLDVDSDNKILIMSVPEILHHLILTIRERKKETANTKERGIEVKATVKMPPDELVTVGSGSTAPDPACFITIGSLRDTLKLTEAGERPKSEKFRKTYSPVLIRLK